MRYERNDFMKKIVYEWTYNLADTNKGYFTDEELLSKCTCLNINDIKFIGMSRAGRIYNVDGMNFVIDHEKMNYNPLTKIGNFIARSYRGGIIKNG